MDSDGGAMHQRLQEWAHWITLGSNGDGYPTKSVLHESWMPPTPGTTPSMKVGAAGNRQRCRATHAAISALSVRLSNTVVVHYCMRLPVAEQALRLACSESTVHGRIRKARALIGEMLLTEA